MWLWMVLGSFSGRLACRLCMHSRTSRSQGCRSLGGPVEPWPPNFGRSVNLISLGGGRLCLSKLLLAPAFSDLPTVLNWAGLDERRWIVPSIFTPWQSNYFPPQLSLSKPAAGSGHGVQRAVHNVTDIGRFVQKENNKFFLKMLIVLEIDKQVQMCF